MDSAMSSPSYRFETFEGPLDLLLHLISKNKVKITDIPIELILKQYMEYLETAKEMNLEIASEFIVMASELVLIKTRLLLPAEKEQTEDPRMDLAATLMEYQLYKNAASELADRWEQGRDIYTKTGEVLPKRNEMYNYKHAPEDIKHAFVILMERARQKLPPSVSVFKGIVGFEPEPVEPKFNNMLKELARRGELSLDKIIRDVKRHTELVAVFLAVLELLNTKRVTMKGDGEKAVLYLCRM